MTMTPAFEAWIRACAEYLRDSRPYLAVYDVDPAALRAAFSIGAAPSDFLASDQVPLATNRDPSLLPFFREDVRRVLASRPPGIDIRKVAPASIQAAYISGASPSEFANRDLHLVGSADVASPIATTPDRMDPRRKGLLGWLVASGALIVGLCVALAYLPVNRPTINAAANSSVPSASNQSGSTTFSTDKAGDANLAGNDNNRQNPDNAPSGDAGSQNPKIVKNDSTGALNPSGAPGSMQGSPPTGSKLPGAPQVSVTSSSEPKPAIDAFFATYSATGDDANPWRMTLHWKTRNVDRVEVSSGNAVDSSVDSPQGEVTYDHDPDGSGPIQRGRVYTLKGFSGDQVSTRAVTADPPP